MKKILSLALALSLCLCLAAGAFAAGGFSVTVINGMDGSVFDTWTVADGEDLVFTISCSPPCDMGPVADGEAGSGVTATDGVITYSDITLGGPNQYPTAETVTIAGLKSDITVTITPNPDEVDAQFPAVTLGAAAASGEASDEASGEASDEASGEASDEASGEASDEAYPLFDEYKAYVLETLLLDSFWQGNEATLKADLDAAATPEDENLQRFLGNAEVDQAPPGVEFPMTYAEWYAQRAGGYSADEAGWKQYLKDYVSAVPAAQEHLDEFYAAIDAGAFDTLPGDMLFTDTYWGFAAVSLDDFVAAGGAVEIPAFDPNLTADAEP